MRRITFYMLCFTYLVLVLPLAARLRRLGRR